MSIQINGTSGISGVDGSATTPALQGTDTNTGLSFGTNELSLNTDGTERFRVGSAGQLGIGGATYGSSGQFLQSQGASAAPQWATVTASTGNDYNFASGSLSGAGGGSTVTIANNLPTDAVKIVITLNSVGWTSGSTTFGLRLGDSTSINSTAGNYTWNGVYVGPTTSSHNRNAYFMLNHGFGGTGERMQGILELNRTTTNAWIATYQAHSTGTNNYVLVGSGWGYSGSSSELAQLQLFVDVGSLSTGSYNVNVFTE